MNTMFTKQSILGKPPSSSYKPKLYSVTPFPKSSVLPKVDKTNALSKPVTSNSAPSTRESKGLQTVKVIASRIFRTNHSKTSRVDNVVPNKPVKSSVRTKPITASQPNVIHRQQANSKLENRKKHKANVRKSRELGSQGSLASSRPSKPRNCLRWVPTGRIFAMCGKLTASSNTENKSDKSVCDNASTSNPSKPSSKGFSNSTSLLGSWKVYSVICSTNYSNGENQVVSKSFAVTTADAFDKRQQQQDSTSSTSTLATTISADGNFDFQNRRDLPINTPLDRVEVLGMIEKRSKVRSGRMPIEAELALEQSQQEVSYEVSRSTRFYLLSHSEIVDIEKVAVRSSLRLPNNKCTFLESIAIKINQKSH
ncbi:hypothetical protein Tco_1343168 [Tanacetum coccineum]